MFGHKAQPPDAAEPPPRIPMRDKLGVCQWFHYQAFEDVEHAIALMRELDVKHLRTGISWADYHRPQGRQWYDWQMRRLADAGLEVLVSIWHTPPSIAEGGVCASPPRRLTDYAAFVLEVIDQWGDCFEALELWNEPNNRYKWDFERYDPDWEKFGRMVGLAGRTARMWGSTTVLGGMMPVDPRWLARMKHHGALDAVDIVAIHGFPHMWWPDAPSWDQPEQWEGWSQRINHIAPHAEGRPIWITETGLATWALHANHPGRFHLQSERLDLASRAPAQRVYWYSLIDLHPMRDAIEGFHVDENEYHMGLVTHEGERKPAFDRMKSLLRTTTEATIFPCSHLPTR